MHNLTSAGVMSCLLPVDAALGCGSYDSVAIYMHILRVWQLRFFESLLSCFLIHYLFIFAQINPPFTESYISMEIYYPIQVILSTDIEYLYKYYRDEYEY